jgi:antitoxin component YwqK of YwqJK toxin-antitoxin module
MVSFPFLSQSQIVREKGESKNGQKEGGWEFFWPDGKLMAREHYSAGKLEGEALAW